MKKLLMLAGVLSLAFMTSCSGCDQQGASKKMDSSKEAEMHKEGEGHKCRETDTGKKCTKGPVKHESSECGMNEQAPKDVSVATPTVKKEVAKA